MSDGDNVCRLSNVVRVFCLLGLMAGFSQAVLAENLPLVCTTSKIDDYLKLQTDLYGQPAEIATTDNYSTQMNWPTLDGWRSVSIIKAAKDCRMFSNLDGFSAKPIWWDADYRAPHVMKEAVHPIDAGEVEMAKARMRVAWQKLSKELNGENCNTHANYLRMAEFCYLDAVPNPAFRWLVGDVTIQYRRELKDSMPLKGTCVEPATSFMVESLSAEQEEQRRVQLCAHISK